LPSRDVTPDTLTQAFVDFILYCNPNYPLDVDTSTLRTNFENLPKSDGKVFQTWRLYELIQKYDSGDIQTWGQLALDLGVEAPDVSKGQSVQKVPQFTVRLKRWMRALHIDAFFEYLLGRQHVYMTDIPHPSDPYPASGRDGVVAEEDLAIRALDPAFRPKRGRRRNSDIEQEAQNDSGPTKKQPKPNDSAAPASAGPFSAQPDDYNDPWAVASAVTPQTFAPWSSRAPSSAMSTAPLTQLRWQMAQSQTPGTPHPMSAIPTSMSAHIDSAFDGEPKSAVTPSSKRRRLNRNAPVISSAWPCANAPGAKPKGRPPAFIRVSQDGPFGIFPVDPNSQKPMSRILSTSGMQNRQNPQNRRASTEPSPPQVEPPTSQPPPEGRPGRLSLQVPPHTGGPVRLATPPALMLNGEAGELGTRSDSDDPSLKNLQKSGETQVVQSRGLPHIPAPPMFSFEALKRVTTSDLLRADLVGRRQRLSGEEAKRLADAMLERLSVPRSAAGSIQDDISRLTVASWLGVSDHSNVPLAPAAGHSKRINVTRFRTDSDGYEEIINDDVAAEGVREVFDVFWNVSMGGCIGTFEMKGLSLGTTNVSEGATTETTHDLIMRKSIEAVYCLDKQGWVEESMGQVAQSAARTSRAGEDHVDWKAKCKAMEFAAHVARGEVERQRKRMFEKIMDAVL
jgi:hypothetical protein